MKQRSKLATLVSLSAALDVNFSLFDALDEAEASAKRTTLRKSAAELGSARTATGAYAQAR